MQHKESPKQAACPTLLLQHSLTRVMQLVTFVWHRSAGNHLYNTYTRLRCWQSSSQDTRVQLRYCKPSPESRSRFQDLRQWLQGSLACKEVWGRNRAVDMAAGVAAAGFRAS